MSRNYNLGSRNMSRAGKMVLDSAARIGAVSFSTAATNSERWKAFAFWAIAEFSVKCMEKVSFEIVVTYGKQMQTRVECEEMAASTAQNYLSAINSVMSLATQGAWRSVSPTHDCCIKQRNGIATVDRSVSQLEHNRIKGLVSKRLRVMLDCQRELGLRFEESAKLDANAALKDALKTGKVTILTGTKGGLKRKVPASRKAIIALKEASLVQNLDRSMIPPGQSYANFQSASYRELSKAGGVGFHSERHSFAQARYTFFSGAPAPVVAQWGRQERFEKMAAFLDVTEAKARALDEYARQQVADELGHGRTEVTNAYLG